MHQIIDNKPLNLKKFIDFIDNNNIEIPQFQRGFVWSQAKVEKLFDSLIKGYPIGSFVLWKTNKRIETRKLFNRNNLKQRPRYYVIDGQQRLLSIYYLCRQNKFTNIKNEFDIYFEGNKDKIIDFRNFSLIKKKKRIHIEYKNTQTEFNYKTFLENINNYKFPIIIWEADKYNKTIEAFERINQGGTKISTDAIFLSESWSSKSEFSKIIHKWKASHKNTICGKLSTIVIIHLFAILYQLECNENDSKKISVSVRKLKELAKEISSDKRNNLKLLRYSLNAIEDTTSYLNNNFKVVDINLLPSQTLITILAIFFYYIKRKNINISNSQKKQIRKWFWRSSLGSRYTGKSYNENIPIDPIRMKKLALNKKSFRIRSIDLDYKEMKSIDMHSGKSTQKNAIKLMLWNNDPINLNGDTLNINERESRRNKKEDDHFYPHYLLEKNFYKEKDINSILNICFLRKGDNASKGEKLPSEWLTKLREKLENINQNQEIKFFRNHLLPFKSIRQIIIQEKDLYYGKGKIKKKPITKQYNKFLKDRCKIFSKKLNNLQKGNFA